MNHLNGFIDNEFLESGQSFGHFSVLKTPPLCLHHYDYLCDLIRAYSSVQKYIFGKPLLMAILSVNLMETEAIFIFDYFWYEQ